MNSFLRVLRLALRHRTTFIASIGCALAVAALWGGNITVVYPFVEVIFEGQSMPEWIDEQIELNEKAIAGYRDEIDELKRQLPAAANAEQQANLERSLSRATMRLEAEESVLARNRRLHPYLHAWLPRSPFRTLLVLIGLLLLGTVVKDLFLVGSSILVAKLAELATFDLRMQFYERLLQMDLAGYGHGARGDLMNRFTSDMASVNAGLQTLFGRAVREPLKMLVCLAGAALVCWRLLFLSLIVAPLGAWLMNRLSRSLKRANRRAMEEMSVIYNTLSETLAGIKVVKAFTMERYELRRFRRIARDYLTRSMRIARYNSLISPLNEMMGMVMISLAILAGAYLALNQATHLGNVKMSDRPLTLGSLLLFYGLLAGVSDPARKLSDVFGRLQAAAAACDRIFQVLDRESSINDPQYPVLLPRHHRDLVVQDVNFSYQPGQPILHNISVRVRFGETIAIVGPNGCGKSTLLNLVPRFFDPDEGCVLLDGVDLRCVRRRDLRMQIGLVTQETLLFDDTVYNNIRYGAPRARPEQIFEAAKRAHAHRFIEEKLPDGYQTIVGPGGNRLSGGQRQRIALARAILRDPPILILDEATSQIDLESEQLIHQVLEQFTRNRTTLLITHRISTLCLADRVVAMENGRIIDTGTHDELMARCEFYRRMHTLELRESA